MASNTIQLNTWSAKRVIADNNSADWAGALLHSGVGARPTTGATSDTWIFADDYGTTAAPWGIKHDQTNNDILFIGGGVTNVKIHLGSSKVTATTFAGKATSAGSADTATTATNLTNTPSLLISGNTIAVKAGEKTSSYITVPYATKASQDADGNTISSTYLKLSGGNMTGEGGIQYPTASGNNKSNNWISLGGGYGTGSGKSGVKLIVCEQSDALMGLGADCGGGPYEMSLIAAENPSDTNVAYFRFLKH